jgi:hypothetical protein
MAETKSSKKTKIPKLKKPQPKDFAQYWVILAGNIEDAYDMAGVPVTAEKCMEMAFELVKGNFAKIPQGSFGACIVIPNLSLQAIQPEKPPVVK